ncbi:MAG: hypothetical protein LBH51_05495 [Treponema sp.]|nr:hypothetical protein [Treponema sp.]
MAQEPEPGLEPEEPFVRIVEMPPVKVYIDPPEGGTQEERDFFKENFEMELMGAAYEVAQSREESEFFMSLTIIHTEEEDPPNELRLVLYNTRRPETPIIAFSRTYADLTEMYTWNLWMIYQAMANAPILKLMPDATLRGVAVGWPVADDTSTESSGDDQSGDSPPPAAPSIESPGDDQRGAVDWPPPAVPPIESSGDGQRGVEELLPHVPALYLGLRLAGFQGLYTIQTMQNYGGGVSRSFSGEAAMVLEFHPLRYLSAQMEVDVAYEVFAAARESREGGGSSWSLDNFSALSMHIPLFVKTPVTFGRFSLSPYAGGYLVFPLGPLRGQTGSYSYRIQPPLGLSVGLDAGLALGPGKIILGVRYDRDLGTILGEGEGIPFYSRDRLTYSAGYVFKLWEWGEWGLGARKVEGQ